MNYNTLQTTFALLLGLLSAGAQSALSPDQIEALGTALTPWGATVAGSEDGGYPAYTGGNKTPPPGFDPHSGIWPDPFPDDKPLFSIDASNMEQYKDKLMEGQIELMRRYPDFRMDIYPSRRSAWFPENVIDNTLANAKNPECKTSTNGVGIYGCWGGIPFPIPTTGYEAMWNHILRPRTPSYEVESSNFLVDTAGSISLLVTLRIYYEYPYYDPDQAPYEGRGLYQQRFANRTIAPARDAGKLDMIWYPLHFDTDDQRAWTYSTGQRRVRLAPEFSYDTPSAQMGGTMYYDELNLFAGRMDRFDFQIKGHKLMYMPYNNYRYHLVTGGPENALGPDFVKPEVMRWELRRVLVIEATPLPGVRHVASRKRFYMDEDLWALLAYEGWDHSDRLFRVIFATQAPNYYQGGILEWSSSMVSHDLSKGQYTAIQTQFRNGSFYRTDVPARSDAEMSPNRMSGRGIR